MPEAEWSFDLGLGPKWHTLKLPFLRQKRCHSAPVCDARDDESLVPGIKALLGAT
ncbi:hypothetical protein P3T25_009879 [Paraburkholderia sp. GAS32]